MNLYKSLEVARLSDIKREKSRFVLTDILPIPAGTVNMISSAGGMGKTFLAIRLASEFVAETGDNALCWFSEDHSGEIAIRYDTLRKNNMITADNQDKISIVLSEPKQFALKQSGVFKANYEALEELIKDCIFNRIKLIIIDPLLAFYGGDENDNSQARIFMQPFLEWSKKQGVTILFIHHSAKGGGTRGAGAFRDAVRTLYEIDYIRDDRGDVDEKEKDAGKRTVSLVKDNRNAFYWFSKKYNSFEADITILPRVINYTKTEYRT